MKYNLFLMILLVLITASCEKQKTSSTTTEQDTDISHQTSITKAASIPQPPREEPANTGFQFSSQLESVAHHLDSNGAHFSVTDTSGDLDAICEFIDEIIKAIPSDELDVPSDIDISLRDTLKRSGFGHITAKGESSRKVGDHWHNRIFYATGGHRQGVLSALGGKGSRYITPDFSPANTDLLFETQVNLKQLKLLFDQIAHSLGEEAEEEFTEAIKQKFLGAAMSAGDVFGKFDARLSIAVTLDDQKTWQSEDGGTLYPTVDLVMLLDGATWLWDEFGKSFEENGETITRGNVTHITSKEPVNTPMGNLHPIIVIDRDKDQIWFALQEKTLQTCQSESPKLWNNSQFKKAINGLPNEGNTLFFVSNHFCETITSIPIKNAEQLEDADQFKSLYIKLTSFITRSKSGYAWALANRDDGILIASNSPFSNKNYSVTSMATVSSVMIPSLFIGANIYKKGADRATCILNIRNIHQAVRAHQNLNGLKIGDKIDPNGIFGPGKYIEQRPTCPLGHEYTLSKTFPKIGTSAATCEHPEHHPDDTDGW